MNAPDKLPANPEPHVMKTYGRLPMALSHGRGCWVWDTDGKKYLDALAGIAVNTLGHAHPKLVPALQEQVGKLIHTSNYYGAPLQERLAAKLCEISGLANVFFCNSGLEANEGAIKIARKYGHDKGIERPEIVVYEKAFHGRSIATLSATGNAKVQAGFEPLVEGFVRVPLNDAAAIEQVAASNPNVVAVFLEVIQGEGGVNPAKIEYLQQVRRICDQKGWLLMLDEVQCGIGRTGKWFAHQWAGIQPDVMPLAKGLAARRARAGPGQPRHHLRGQPACHARRHRDADHHGRGQAARQRRQDGRAAARGRTARTAGRGRAGGGARPGTDDRHRARPALHRVARTRGRSRPDDQRDRRPRDPPAAAAHPRRARSPPGARHPVSADQGLPRHHPCDMKPGMSLIKHYLQFKDLRAEEYAYLFERTAIIKKRFKNYEKYTPLVDRTLAMIFEKASTRTRVSFEAGMYQMGGSVVNLTTGDSQLGRAEPIEDSARVISRMVDLVMIRTYEQTKLEAFAAHSRVPVINGLTNEYHPCQILADVFTFIEQRGSIAGKVVAWVGDGNNMANTWLQAAHILGFTLHVSTPTGYEIDPRVAGVANTQCVKTFRDPLDACRGAHLVTTDVWTSMGYEAENEARQKAFADWCVDREMMAAAQRDALFMHCLPAHRGEEVEAEVIDGPQSVVWDEAENRMHVQKALMEYLLIGRIG
jgi:ornithine carbamoyltransferase